MPRHNIEPSNEMIRKLINDPNNWLMGEVVPPSGRIGQIAPTARDTIEMIKRLQGGLSKVPSGVKKLIPSSEDLFQFHPKSLEMMEKMYREANPIFRRMQEQGLFYRYR